MLICCKDPLETNTCPDGFTLEENDCACKELNINGYCISRCLPEDQEYTAKGMLGQYFNEKEWCDGFESLPSPMLIRLEAYPELLNYGPSIYFGLHEEEFGLSLKPNWVTNDSFQSDSLLYAFAGHKIEAGFVEMKVSNDPRRFVKLVNGENLYLRCYIKILHERLLRVHFTWENSNDEIRETCTRIFHK